MNLRDNLSPKKSRIMPEGLRIDPDRRYAFKSPLKTRIVRIADAFGGRLFPPSTQPIEWRSLKKIAVLRLDHIGDVMMALPAVKALGQALPEAKIDFIVGPWAKDLVETAGLRATPRIFSAKWFTREGAKGGGVKKLKGLLREGQYDAVLELRGVERHILAIYGAGIKYRVGLARTGLGFLLTHRLVYRPGLHEIERNLDLLKQAGIDFGSPPEFPRLYPREENDQTQIEARRKLGIARPVIAIHAVCSAPAKRWPVTNWQRLIESLPKEMDVALIGSEGEKSGIEEIQQGCGRKVYSTVGLLNLPALAAFLKECRLFIGLDSGPAHIAAAVGTPVVSVYSGINSADRWGPRGRQVTILQRKPACSPCELVACPFDNSCMRQIAVEEVLTRVQDSLKG